MRVASFLQSLTGLVSLLTLAAALPSAVTQDDRLTNAQRMARGLAPLKPARLYDASRTNVLRPRASVPPGIEPFSVAAGPAGSSNPNTKRDGGVPGYFSIVGDSLQFSSAQADAATFYYPEPSTRRRIGAVISGGFVDVYAVASGPVYLVKVGTAPTGALVNFINPARYSGDLDPAIPPAGSSTPQSALWVVGTGGVVFLATDYATAAAYDPQASVLLVQTFYPGTQASLAGATAAQGSSLKNPVKFWARPVNAPFGYLWIVPDGRGSLATVSSRNTGNTFYLPNFGTSGPDQRALTTYNGQTRVGNIVPASTGNYIAFTDVTTNANPILSFNIPSSGNGRVSLASGSTPLNLYYTLQNGFLFLPCTGDATSCGTTYTDVTPMCLEVVSGNTAPSVCDAWARSEQARDYVRKSAIYVYDPAGQYTGYVGQASQQNVQPLVASQSSAFPFYLSAATASQPRQELYGIEPTEARIFRWSTARPAGTYRELYLRAQNPNDVATWNIPANPATTELTFTMDNNLLTLYYSSVGLTGCPNAAACPPDRGFRRVCTEFVAFGSTPQLCVAGWQAPTQT